MSAKLSPVFLTILRGLRACFFVGHPVIRSWMLVFFIVPAAFFLWQLRPVFVYYMVDVPEFERLEKISGIWRQAGEIGLRGRNLGLAAPDYFVETESGVRNVYCGYWGQRLLCHIFHNLNDGESVVVYFDKWFGVIAVDHIDKPLRNRYSDYKIGVDRLKIIGPFSYTYGAEYFFLAFLSGYFSCVRRVFLFQMRAQ